MTTRAETTRRSPPLTALLALLVGGAVCVLGAVSDPARFYPAYLVSVLFWTGLSVGALILLCVHLLTGGKWGLPHLFERGAAVVPWMLLSFVPIWFGVPVLFPWAHGPAPAEGSHLQILQDTYLNRPFFIARAAIFFAVWWFLAARLRSRRRDGGPTEGLAAGGLVLLLATVTLAALDWGMSLTPPWFSPVYAVTVATEWAVCGLSFAVLWSALADARHDDTKSLGDRSKVLLTLLLLWVYLSYSQLIVIWTGDIREEIGWYLARETRPWMVVGGIFGALHFALPFVLLVFLGTRRRVLILCAALVFGTHLLGEMVMVLPSVGKGPADGLLYLAGSMAAIGALWLWRFSTLDADTRREVPA